MGYLIGIAVLAIASVIGLIAAGGNWTDDSGNKMEFSRFKARTGILGAALLIFFLLTGACSIHIVPTGEVGLTSTFGKIDGKTDASAGLIFTAPWMGFDTESIQVQRQQFKDDLVAFSKETQDVFVKVTVNYHIDPINVITLRQQVGDDVFGKILQPQIITATKEETVKYAAVDIAPNREAIRQSVKSRVQEFITKNHYGVTLDDILFDNIDFSQQFKQAIENKQAATQQALAAAAQVQVKQAEADQAVAVAKGSADATRIRAQGDADANNTINASLTDRVLQNKAIDKLAGNVQIALIPSGNGLILDPSTLLKPAAK